LFSSKTGICKSNPKCYGCPIKEICLTFKNWKGVPIKPITELKTERKKQSKAKRLAKKQLIEAHPEEYNKLLEEAKKSSL
jgi:adenine-specific DNA glycosylase